jgi:hypothetical protein
MEILLEVLASVHAVISFTDKPWRACCRTPRCGLQLFEDELRPTSPPPPWTHRTQPGTNSYTLTSEGIRVAVFCTKLHGRLLRPLLEPDQPPAPVELPRALWSIDQVLGDSRERGSGPRPETCHKVVQRLGDQEDLVQESFRDLLAKNSVRGGRVDSSARDDCQRTPANAKMETSLERHDGPLRARRPRSGKEVPWLTRDSFKCFILRVTPSPPPI